MKANLPQETLLSTQAILSQVILSRKQAILREIQVILMQGILMTQQGILRSRQVTLFAMQDILMPPRHPRPRPLPSMTCTRP